MWWWNLRRLKSSDVQTRRRAIKGLSKSRSPRALGALMAALGDESHLAQQVAAAISDVSRIYYERMEGAA